MEVEVQLRKPDYGTRDWKEFNTPIIRTSVATAVVQCSRPCYAPARQRFLSVEHKQLRASSSLFKDVSEVALPAPAGEYRGV